MFLKIGICIVLTTKRRLLLFFFQCNLKQIRKPSFYNLDFRPIIKLLVQTFILLLNPVCFYFKQSQNSSINLVVSVIVFFTLSTKRSSASRRLFSTLIKRVKSIPEKINVV